MNKENESEEDDWKNQEVQRISKEEVRLAMKRMKSGKAVISRTCGGMEMSRGESSGLFNYIV